MSEVKRPNWAKDQVPLWISTYLVWRKTYFGVFWVSLLWISLPGPTCDKRHELHSLPGEHPHVDDALMNHLILEGVRGCRSLIVGLKGHITWQTAKNNRYDLHVIMRVIVKQYLAWGQKPNKNSHPCYWHTWLVHVQMFKALVEQPEYTAPNVKDRKVSVSVPNSEAHTEGHQAYRKVRNKTWQNTQAGWQHVQHPCSAGQVWASHLKSFVCI